MRLNWKERVKDPRLASKTSPVSRQCFSKTTMLVLMLGKIRHDHRKDIHENSEINAAAKETYRRLMEAVKLLKAAQMPKYLTPLLGSLVRPFSFSNSNSKLNLIADLIKFNYAIVCQFETG